MLRKAPAVSALAFAAHIACAQTYIYVANNGNLEGSVTSYRAQLSSGFPALWTLTTVDRVVTGSRTSLSQPCPGCNTAALAVSPDGSLLASTHASGSPTEQLTIYELDGEGGMSVAATLSVPDTSLDLVWVDTDFDDSVSHLLAPMVLGSVSEVRLYRFDRGTQTLSLAATAPAGQFSTSVQEWNGRIYANDSFGNAIRVYEYDLTPGSESLTLVQTQPSPVFGVHLLATYDDLSSGGFLYATGGISGGGDKIAGFAIDGVTGLLTPLPSLFTSAGASPSLLSCGGYDQIYVGHGTDATVRRFGINRTTGALTQTNDVFDVGLQGSIGGMAAAYDCAFAGLLVTDDTSTLDGLVGLYTLAPDLSPAGATVAGPVASGGIAPSDIAVVRPRFNFDCPADVNGDGLLDFGDIALFIEFWNAGSCLADLDGCGTVDFGDVSAFLRSFTDGCP
jgi:6-phosphogluconolactonase (cycloisomerase 2 family)